MDYSDQAQKIRNGEELDVNRVEAYLKDTLPGLDGPVHIEQFPGGFSNLTYLVRVGDREMVLRRPPFGSKVETAHDMRREYDILSALRPVYQYCPEPLAYTDDASILDCSFYVMERLRGIILRRDLQDGFTLAPEQARVLSGKVLDVHLELHGVDYKQTGLSDFGRPEGYVRRQVEGWSKRYRNARTDDAPSFEEVMDWLAAKMPPDIGRGAVVHNDFRLDNVVLDTSDYMNIIGVLDWEMATIGDPLMDLGNSLGYWIQDDDPEELQMIRLMPTNVEGMLSRDELVARYAKKSGLSIDNFDFYYCFGLFRMAVIGQQIYYRYYHGLTRDERFKVLIVGIHILEQTAQKLIERSDL